MTAGVVCEIIVPIWNLAGLTERCLESVRQKTRTPVGLILIDNGSEAPTQALLKRFQQESGLPVKILRNEQNLGFIRAVNQGIRAASAPWVCLLNNDTVVASGWLEEMLQVAQSDPKIGLVNPTSNCLGYDAQGAEPETIVRKLAPLSGQVAPLATALGFCLLARRELFDRIGLLDEQFGMGNFDDDDLTLRVRQAGLKAVRALAAYVHHEEKASFKRLPGAEKAFAENRKRFEQKWGRRLRILWGPPRPAQELLETIAGAGHWVLVVGPETAAEPRSNHAQVEYREYPARSWRPKATWRLIAKRKKPFDLVVSQDAAWSAWIRRLRPLHRAELLNRPTEHELLERCRTLSQAR